MENTREQPQGGSMSGQQGQQSDQSSRQDDTGRQQQGGQMGQEKR